MTGQRWGRLVVLEPAENDHNGQARWLCQCDCGTTTIVKGQYLRNGETRSCGCLHREVVRRMGQLYGPIHGAASATHGHSANNHWTPTYVSWTSMKQRCLGQSEKDRLLYYDRGIQVCDRWLHSFENFLTDMGERPEGTTLDRIDNDGNYEPDNCRWATASEQRRNQRRSNAG